MKYFVKFFTLLCISGLLQHYTANAQAYDLIEYDLWPGKSFSNPRALYPYNNSLYFFADDSTHGPSLWKKADGDQPQIIYSFPNYKYLYGNITGLHGKLYFPGYDSVHGEELWVYDGVNSPRLAFDVYTGSKSSVPLSLTSLGNSLYFLGNDSTAIYRELFEYNPATNSVVKRTNFSKNNTFYTGISWIRAFNDRVVMSCYNNDIGRELFLYDPKVKVAWMLHDIAPGNQDSYPVDLLVYKDKLFFTATNREGVMDTFQLYVYDGIKAPHKIKELDDINVYKYANNNTTVLYKNNLYILTTKEINKGYWIYKLNPDNYSGEMVTDINDEFGGNLFNFFVHNDRFFFEGLNRDRVGKPGRIWMYEEGKKPVSVANFEYGNAQITELTSLGNSIFLAATTRENGRELFELKANNTDVPQVSNSIRCTVYPNPVKGDAYLEFTLPSSQVLELSIVGVDAKTVYNNGKILYSASLHKVQIPMSNLPAGSYVYMLTGDNKVVYANGKLVKY